MNTYGGCMDREAYLQVIEDVIAGGPFHDDWDSLGRFEVPVWYRNAKFGIFIHWGIYSVPAFGSEWYSRNMYIQGTPEFEHHVKTYGAQKDFGYRDFIPMFRAEQFDAEKWADLFKESGAKYVIPVAEHHDGFQMYRSEVSHYNAYEMGPKRDTLGELKKACEERQITIGVSSHRIEHWFFMGHGREFDSDIREPLECGDFYWPAMPERPHFDKFSEPMPTEEFLNDWLIRTCELADRYQPRVVYFDWWIQHSAVKPYLKKFAAYYYNRAKEWGIEPAINYKHDAFVFGSAVVDMERGQFADIKPFFWQTDTAVARNSWCYTTNQNYKTAEEIICMLVDVVSKNGTMLLNIGPKADGTIPEGDAMILREIGAWLKVNGEAIYDTHYWRIASEGPTKVAEGQFTDGAPTEFTSEDIRFTVKGSSLYAIVLHCPEDGQILIRSLATRQEPQLQQYQGMVKQVALLGYDGELTWQLDQEGLKVSTRLQAQKNPVVVKITMD